jgi:[histone H3]-lysine4/36 N-trimethyltransferase SMYD
MNICSLPSGIDITVDENSCRGVVACKSFAEGEVVMSNISMCQNLLDTQIAERCSFCLHKPENLFQCSKCSFVRYCSRDCQKNDWAFHKTECKAIKVLRRNMHASLFQDACLLIRMFQVLKLQSNDSICESKHDHIRCGNRHVLDMSIPAGYVEQYLSPEDIHVAKVVHNILKSDDPLSSITDMQLRFRCNNFGILDELMQCVGAGVFPSVALLNHSCVPNCILRYSIAKNQPVKLQVI